MDSARASFESTILPHLNSAYNLARWLTGSDRDAEDVVQDAYLRAFRFYEGFRGGDARAWLLAIVRRCAFTWMEGNRRQGNPVEFDEELHGGPDAGPDPALSLLQQGDFAQLHEAIETLPPLFREALLLRELEGCSYKEISEITGAPTGTVMSRLARARTLLQTALVSKEK